MKRTLILAAMLMLSLGWGTAAAHADSIVVTLDTPLQTIHPGDTTVTFSGTVTADPGNLADVYLNGDSNSIDAALTLDDTPFLTNFPLTLSAGDSVHDVMFTITLDGTEDLGPYLGTFQILGGADGGANDTIGSVNFEIDNVSSDPSATPEPSSLALLATGAGAIAAALRRKRLAS